MTPGELKSRRLRLTLSRAALASRLHVTPNTIFRWESGRMAIPPYLQYAVQWIAQEREEELRQMTNQERDAENDRLMSFYRDEYGGE